MRDYDMEKGRDYHVLNSEFETAEVGEDAGRRFLNSVYNWMAAGLAATGGAAYVVSQEMMNNPQSIFRLQGTFLALMIGTLILVLVLSAGIMRLAPGAAKVMFVIYALANGALFAPLFLLYTKTTIYMAFFTCAGTFGATSLFGYVTRRNLQGLGSFLIMGLFGLILASVVNLLLQNSLMNSIITYAGVALFIGLTAYDTQKLKMIAAQLESRNRANNEQTEGGLQRFAILGALALYLDFINLFLLFLRLFGGRRD